MTTDTVAKRPNLAVQYLHAVQNIHNPESLSTAEVGAPDVSGLVLKFTTDFGVRRELVTTDTPLRVVVDSPSSILWLMSQKASNCCPLLLLLLLIDTCLNC